MKASPVSQLLTSGFHGIHGLRRTRSTLTGLDTAPEFGHSLSFFHRIISAKIPAASFKQRLRMTEVCETQIKVQIKRFVELLQHTVTSPEILHLTSLQSTSWLVIERNRAHAVSIRTSSDVWLDNRTFWIVS
ncbi:hypothetical protein ATANTOWER_016599 [Ataeniobius toweri]|uniref:Uncharacterized protein n=1 Tax=Ataeniobius toweri TaxID=208326 RepID=A0ABU7A6R8_9TELE|nr:hypothetical protein [Ataeniobius toweri]